MHFASQNLKLRTLTSTINYGFLWRNKQRMRRRLTNASHTHKFYKQTFWYNNLVRHLEKYKTRIFDHWRGILRNLSDVLTEDFLQSVFRSNSVLIKVLDFSRSLIEKNISGCSLHKGLLIMTLLRRDVIFTPQNKQEDGNCWLLVKNLKSKTTS